MSRVETHIGRLKKVDLQGKSIEDWSKEKCIELGYSEKPTYHTLWSEYLKYDILWQKIFFTKNDIWEVLESSEIGDNDIIILNDNPDGTKSYTMRFYNGGTCLCEILENMLE
jgi:hypothetical protein